MSLKKEWKNKTLDTSKMYWVLFKDCKSPEVRKLNEDCQFIDKYGFPISPVRIIDVLDVCDYDELQRFKKGWELYSHETVITKQLRKLLKECIFSLEYHAGMCPQYQKVKDLLTKIDEALK
mgnify:FL=1